MLILILGAAIYGAKRPLLFNKIYAKAKTMISLQSQPPQLSARKTTRPRQIEQPYRAKSVLDLPSKLHPKDHQEYLAGLREKYKDKLPLPQMLKIDGGKFTMGCLKSPCFLTQLPTHEVNVPAFAMAATEVTFEQWDTCVAFGGCYTMPGDLGFGRGERPVFAVSWDDVTSQYIRWLNENTEGGYRLPSEAEWEYAARAGTTTTRYWGDENPSCDPESPLAASWGAQPWWKNEKPCPEPGTTVPVGSFKPNPWGLYDMLGSVHEWTNDCENNKDYTGAPTDGSAWRDSVCSRIVTRGGAWTSTLSNMKVHNRKVYDKHTPFERVGFRLVRDIPN